ncbi:hypothetical protein [Puia dinghuensis]|uniref:DUF4280 domain-containing protein n=1 Tax=Puia dinghuensis TaxID=1792502 RepID=A0A8J2UA70_9BACT|nr:hypothetical protein [Puia dinghuensis]GGA88656.1 hypothetical protein GCM10011511_09840 [Puia dinghuensis]
MPGFILHEGAIVQCVHGGLAQPTVTVPRVLVMGMPVTVQPAPYGIVGCVFNVSGAPMPCVTAQWTTAATRVFAMGLPVLVLSSQATCIPNGTPVIISETQTMVSAM